MKRPLLILPIFMLLAPSASPQYVLRLEARPLDRIPETEGSVWNLSDAEYTKGNNPDYVIYGDSLFSETVEGIRRWYALSPDTVRFIREESMRHSFEPYGSVPTAATGMAGMESRIDTVRGEGFSYNTMRLLREGTYSSRGPVAGRLGTGARRTIGYDVHGWVRATGTSTRSGEFYEYIRYADEAAKPRYNGFISRRQWGKLNGFSHTYDYTYDGNGFLKQAQHADGMYTVGYAYDDRGNIVSMRRMGVTDMLRDGIPGGYGVLDDIAASYSGNRLTSLSVSSGAKTFSRRTGIGRTGGFTLAYDDAGRLSRDGSRDISSIRYDNGGHPSLVTFGNLSTVSYRRDGLGNLLETVYSERSGGTSSVPTFRLGERREYTSGGHVISNGRLVMSRFGGGYFDGSGNPHYYVTDWQGNNIGVVDRNGLLEQRTDYYPYGEPWVEPEATASVSAGGNRFLFGDRERTRSGGLNEYRFPACDYVPGFPRFATIDPMCERTPWLSPYAYCAGNPVMYIDPTGTVFTESSMSLINEFTSKVQEKVDKKALDGMKFLAKAIFSKNGKDIMKNIEKASGCFQKSRQYREVLDEIDVLRNSETVYDISLNNSNSTTSEYRSMSAYNVDSDVFEIRIDGILNVMLAHELKHAYQFETGALSTSRDRSGEPFYDMTDEYEAYARGALFGPSHIDKRDYIGIKKGDYRVNDHMPESIFQYWADQYGASFKARGTIYKPKSNIIKQ